MFRLIAGGSSLGRQNGAVSPGHRALALLAVVAVVAGCSREEKPPASEAFCRAADRYNTELERQQERGKVDTQRQIERVADIAATAPEGIRAEAERFLDALRRVETDPSVQDDPEVREAVDAVNRYANQACGVYDRRGL
jgi:hypothetical protein